MAAVVAKRCRHFAGASTLVCQQSAALKRWNGAPSCDQAEHEEEAEGTSSNFSVSKCSLRRCSLSRSRLMQVTGKPTPAVLLPLLCSRPGPLTDSEAVATGQGSWLYRLCSRRKYLRVVLENLHACPCPDADPRAYSHCISSHGGPFSPMPVPEYGRGSLSVNTQSMSSWHRPRSTPLRALVGVVRSNDDIDVAEAAILHLHAPPDGHRPTPPHIPAPPQWSITICRAEPPMISSRGCGARP